MKMKREGRLKRMLKRFIKSEKGLEMVEYVLIAALVVLAGIVAWRSLGGKIVDTVGRACQEIDGKVCPK
jgi:Flp pilus assembly pilin Flp